MPWGEEAYFDRSRFDADLKRIQAFYADRGYPDARVTGFDVKLNDKQDAVDVTLTIAEGEPVTVAAVEFVGFDVIPADHLDDMKKRRAAEGREPRDRQLVVATHEMAVNELRDHGYPYAKVATDEDDGRRRKQATLTFTAEPGTLAHFGPVEIVGNKSVSDNVIRRQLTFKPGDLYRRSVVQDSQRRLYGMELFQFANIEPLEPGAAARRSADARDRRGRQAPARELRRRLRHRGEGARRRRVPPRELPRRRAVGRRARALVVARSRRPRSISTSRTSSARTSRWAAKDSSGTPSRRPTSRSSRGGKVTLTHRQNERTSWAVSLDERAQQQHDRRTMCSNDPTLRDDLIALGLDPTTGEQDGTLNALGFDLQHSTADNLLNARRGYQLAFHAEEAGRLLPGTFNYYAVVGRRAALPAVRRAPRRRQPRCSSATSGRSATIRRNVPFSKKYFLGGATSIRGWGRYEVSPLSGSGLPIGGNSMLAFSAELRAIAARQPRRRAVPRRRQRLGSESGAFDLDDLRYAVGPGLRYQTPIGPIRFDVGFQLNPIQGCW